MFHFIVVEIVRRVSIFLDINGFPYPSLVAAVVTFPLICWKPLVISPIVFSCALYGCLKHFKIIRVKEPKLVGPCLARMFFKLAENALPLISDGTLKNSVAEYKNKQMIKDPFYDEKVLILLPDLLTCSDLPIIYGMVKKEMDQIDSDPYSSNLMVNIARGDDSLKVPYEVRGAQRDLEFAVLSLSRHNEKGREYFLCLDNRPLAQLKDCDMTNEELLVEQKSFYDELWQLMESTSNENLNFLERYELLQFKGSLSSALNEFSQKMVQRI